MLIYDLRLRASLKFSLINENIKMPLGNHYIPLFSSYMTIYAKKKEF